MGDKIVLTPGIPTYGSQDYPFTIRGIYRAGSSAVDNQSMMFHWKYADERGVVKGQVGWIVAEVENPDRAAQVALDIDRQFTNSPNETKTDTEKAFSAQFANMLGNLNVLRDAPQETRGLTTISLMLAEAVDRYKQAIALKPNPSELEVVDEFRPVYKRSERRGGCRGL